MSAVAARQTLGWVDKAVEAERIVGKEDAGRIGAVHAEFVDSIMRSGVIVDLDIGRWRGAARLGKNDLGLSVNDFADVPHLIEYGHKRLLPKQITNDLNNAESKIRRNLETHGYKTVFGVFVPEAVYQEWKERHEELSAGYLQAGDGVASAASAFREIMLTDYRKAAQDAWEVGRHGVSDRDVFIQAYIDRVMDAYPDAASIRASFKCDYHLSMIPLTSTIMEAHERETRSRMEAEVQAHYAARKKELINEYLGNLTTQLRTMVFGVCDDLVKAIQEHGAMASRSAERLRNMITKVRTLDCYGDIEVQAALDHVESLLSTGQSDGKWWGAGETEDLHARLLDLREVCRSAVEGTLDVEGLFERFAAVDIA